MNTQQQTQQQQNPLVLFEKDLRAQRDNFAMLLPPAIRPEEFIRVAVTAANINPDLILKCSKRSLFNALMKAAEDKLLPDGREGALVPYKGEAQWIPMREGVAKRVFEATGIILHTGVVRQGDEWDYQRGDNPRIVHRPQPGSKRSDPIIAAYVVAEFPDGRKIKDWMWREEIDEVRDRYARAAKGPWSDPVAYPEMAIKTVIHHLSKDLPLPNEMKRIVHRDDVLYDIGRRDDQQVVTAQTAPAVAAPSIVPAIEQRRSVEGVMDAFASTSVMAEQPARQEPDYHPDGPARTFEPDDPETGEIYDAKEDSQRRDAEDPQSNPDVGAALKALMDAALPTNAGEYEGFAEAQWQAATTEAQREAFRMWWKLTGGTRYQFGMTKDQQEALKKRLLEPQPAG